MEKNEIGFSELKEKYLLHRYPLIMLDRVLDYEKGKYVHAIKCVTGNSPDLLGHFPEKRSMMAGTNIIQAFSQLAIVFFKISNGSLKEGELTLVSSVKAKFLKPVYPGDTLHLFIKPTKLTGSYGMFDVDAKVAGNSVSRGSLTLVKTTESKFPNALW